MCQRLLKSASDMMDQRCESTAISMVSEALAMGPPDSVIALHMRCEALLRRGWAADYRDALVSSRLLRNIVDRDPARLDELVAVSLRDGSSVPPGTIGPASDESQCLEQARRAIWRVVLDVQHAAAVLGIIIPRHQLQHAISVRAFYGTRQQSRESLATLARIDKVADVLHEVLQQLDSLFASIPELRPLSDVGQAACYLFRMQHHRGFYKSCLTRCLTRRIWDTIEALDEVVHLLKLGKRKKRLRKGLPVSGGLGRLRLQLTGRAKREKVPLVPQSSPVSWGLATVN
jgi:hypothetical protein